MFGINKTLNTILTKINEFRQFVTKKLDIMSGVNNETEGIAKRNLTISRETFEKVSGISLKVIEIFEILRSEVEEDQSDFFFSQFKIDNIIIEGELEKITMNEFQKVTGTVKALKKNKKEATVEAGSLVVETDHPDKVAVTILNDTQFEVAAIEGSVTEPTAILVTARADADLGEGVREITKVGSLTLTPGEAESLELEFSEPTDITPANPEE